MKCKGMWREKLIYLAIILVGSGLTASVQSSDWIVAPGLSIDQIFTDNASLDSEKESDSITRIKPRLSLYRQGARAKLDLSYAPEYRHYWQETHTNKVVHFLRADGDIELVKNHFFVDGWATADERPLNSSGRTGIDGITGIDNFTEVYTSGISPYFTSRLGPALTFEARYGLNRVYYAEEDRDSSTGQRADLVLGSGQAVRGMPWELRLEQSNIEYDDREEDDRIKRVRAEMAYQLNRKWALGAVLGYEQYELATTEDIDGEIWGVGFIYSPSSRTRLTAGLGERFFGDDYYLDFSYRGSRTVWTAGYKRDFVTARDEVIRPSLFERIDAFGNLIRDPALSEPASASRGGPTLTDNYYLLERFTTDFNLVSGRTTLALSAGYSARYYDEAIGPGDTEDVTLSGRFSRRLRPQTTAFINLNWRDHSEDLQDYEQWVASLDGSYQLGTHTELTLSLARLDRKATLDENSYDENRVKLSLNRSW
jgi:uncharacterized protein (PEP-CTERM system associated)